MRKRVIFGNQALHRELSRNVDSYDHADAPIAVSPSKTQLQASAGNPAFTAQFDVQTRLKYFTVAAGVWTGRTAAYVLANAAALATQLPGFVFGNSDFASGYKKLRENFPLAGGWVYGSPFVYGRDTAEVHITGLDDVVALDATALAQLQVGDVVIPVSAAIAGPVYYVGLVIVRCTQVGYGTLLDALNSDMFTMNMLRYIISDTSAVGLAQYNNNVFVMKQSLFGKFDSDFVSPNSFKLPEQMQDGVIDIPLVKGIDKQVALATYINYDVVDIQWSLFVAMVNKLAY
jgi:hypothetical protein